MGGVGGGLGIAEFAVEFDELEGVAAVFLIDFIELLEVGNGLFGLVELEVEFGEFFIGPSVDGDGFGVGLDGVECGLGVVFFFEEFDFLFEECAVGGVFLKHGIYFGEGELVVGVELFELFGEVFLFFESPCFDLLFGPDEELFHELLVGDTEGFLDDFVF